MIRVATKKSYLNLDLGGHDLGVGVRDELLDLAQVLLGPVEYLLAHLRDLPAHLVVLVAQLARGRVGLIERGAAHLDGLLEASLRRLVGHHLGEALLGGGRVLAQRLALLAERARLRTPVDCGR